MPAKHMLARKEVAYSPEPTGEGRESDWDEGTLVRYERMPEMRVGGDYQAVIPTICEPGAYKPPRKEGLLVWSPQDEGLVPKSKLDSFIQTANEKYGYSLEQALGMLFWHKYDVSKATEDLVNFVPFPSDFTLEDRVLFEQGYHSHGKSFHRIKEMMPDKSMGSLIQFYYTWKKGKHGTSQVERNVKCKPLLTEGDEVKQEEAEEKTESKEGIQDSNFEARRQQPRQRVKRGRKSLLSPPCRSSRSKRLPRGMFLTAAAVAEYTTDSANSGLKVMNSLNVELNDLKTKIQASKQLSESESFKPPDGLMALRPSLPPKCGLSRWTSEEFLMAVEVVRRYGRDFQAMAEIVGNKTVQQCRNFFMNYRRKYDLDHVLEEYRAERERRGVSSSSPTEEMTQDLDVHGEKDRPDDDVTDDGTDTGKQGEAPSSKRPRLELKTEDVDDGEDEEIARAFSAESEVQPGFRLYSDTSSNISSKDGTSLPGASKEAQSKSSKENHTSGRFTDKTTGRTKRH